MVRNFIRARQEALLARLGRRATPSTVQTAAGGSIAGTIYEPDGITPHLTNAFVTAYTPHGRYAGYGYTSYNSGDYTITNLPPGDYLLQVDATGYASTFYDGADDWQTAVPVHVTENQQTAGIDFALRRYNSAITGRVTGPAGSPVLCEVIASKDRVSHSYFASTDLDGRYTVYLPPGSFKLWVNGGPDGLAPQWYGNAASYADAPSIQVAQGDTVRGMDFSLVKGATLSGRVAVLPGDTLESTMAGVSVESIDLSFYFQASLDSSCGFSVSGLASGSYRVRASYFGPGNLVDTWYGGAYDEEHAVPVQITAPDSVRDLLIILSRGGSLSGTVSAQNLSGASFSVAVYDRHRRYFNEVTTASDGSFLVPRLPTGSYTIRAGMLYGWGGVLQPVTMWYPGVMRFEEAAFVDVVAPAVHSGLTMTLQAGGGVTGTVTGPDGLPPDYPPGVSVFDKDGQSIGSATADASGRFSINGLPAGEVRLFCSTSRRSELAAEWSDGKASFPEAAPVTLTAGQQRVANFSLEKGAMMTGFLVDSQRHRLTSDEHTIRLGIYGAATGNWFGWLENTVLGGFELLLLPRAYKIGAVPAMWNSSKTPDSLTMTFYPHGADFADAGTTPVSLQSGAAQDLQDFTLEKAAGAITGTIYYGQPPRPLTSGTYVILAFTANGFTAGSSGYDDSYGVLDGTYRIGGLRPGTYHLLALTAPDGNSYSSAMWYEQVPAPLSVTTSVTVPAIPPASKPVNVGSGAVSGIDFHLEPATAVAGTPNSPDAYRLEQNFPNPFNPTTKIQFTVPRRSHATLVVYNTLGQQVAVLVDAVLEAGRHLVHFGAGGLASGVYFYRLSATPLTIRDVLPPAGRDRSFVDTKKLLLVH